MARQYDIQTPDGKTITVEGPEDATDDELIAFAQSQIAASGSAQYAKGPVEVKKPQAAISPTPVAGKMTPGATKLKAAQDVLGRLPGSNMQSLLMNGASFGLSDEASGVVNALGNIVSSPFTGNFNPSQAYTDGRDLERSRIDSALSESPVAGTLAQLVGGFIGGQPIAGAANALGGIAREVPDALATIRSSAKMGAAGGALAGWGGGEDTETSVVGGVLGGAFGGALGAAVPAVAMTARSRIGGLKRFFGKDPSLPRQIVGDALAADANTGAEAGAIMDRAHSLGVPYMLADTGENTRSLVASVGRQPGPSRTTVLNAVQQRQMGQADRIRGAIERDLGPLTNQAERTAEMQAQQRGIAAEARQGASANLTQAAEGIGPNIDRLASGSQARESFGTAYDAARSRSREAYNAPALVNPQPIEIPSELFARDLRSAADDFYGDGGGEMPATLRAIIDDAAAPDATTRTLTNIDRRLADFGGEATMSGNRSDAAFATRLRGVLNNFADRAAPQEYRAALANAKAVRAEQGRLFETRDLPRTFANDRFGNPMVGDTSIPERLVRPGAPGGDTADSLIAAVGPEAAEAMMRQELRRTLDSMPDLTPAGTQALNRRYAESLQRFPALASDLAAVNRHAESVASAAVAEREAGREGTTAIERGYNALNLSPDEIGRAVDMLPPDQTGAFGEGVRNQLANQVGRRVDDADKARALVGTPNRRSVLERVFPGEGLDRFSETLAAEQSTNQTFRSALQGSQTAERLAYDAQVTDPGLVESAVDSSIRGAKDGWLGLALSTYQKIKDVDKFGGFDAGKNVRQSVASLLTETDPAELSRILAEANTVAAGRLQQGRLVADFGGNAGVAAGQGLVVAGSNVGK